jgi:AmmeMemoRadiSam system protein B/AmmeMemoRadiSam system protein A
MVKRLAIILSFAMLLASCKVPVSVKEPSVAGSFYPADSSVLQNTVDAYLAYAKPDTDYGGRLLALISPHAGHQFSGWVAAYGYKRLENASDIDTVIIIGPSHRLHFTGASVYTEGKFKTPLGEIPIDEALAESLLNSEADVKFLPEAFDGEHALEVQLPFLQRVLADFRIVPILISNPTREMNEHLVMKLTETLAENRNALIIASTDMSHYYNYTTALEMDGKMIKALERISVIEVESLIRGGEGELCGAYPVLVTLEAARRLGANQSALYKYANSGDVLPSKDSVVGYSSMGFYKAGLTGEDKRELIALARQAVVNRVKEGKLTTFETENPRLKADGAVFVTIKRNGMLRGCIGHARAFVPLYKSVIKNAEAACVNDRRFKPMTTDELDDMEIEISVLSPLVPIKGIDEIEMGRHGLYLMVDNKHALFLPQVPVEAGWDRTEYLRQLAMKAGLKPDAWKGGALYKFEAEVFNDKDVQSSH